MRMDPSHVSPQRRLDDGEMSIHAQERNRALRIRLRYSFVSQGFARQEETLDLTVEL